MTDLSKLYETRFHRAGLTRRQRVWEVLCRAFFQRLMPENAAVVDLACGYGEFINNIQASRKHAVDLNDDAEVRLHPDVTFHRLPATQVSTIGPGTMDVVFTSNFLEHLSSRQECLLVLQEIHALLRPGGTTIIMGPNIRYAYAEYWDFFDHCLPLSDRSLAEALRLAGFDVQQVVPRFLPYTMNGALPAHPLLVRLYLACPPLWRLFGRQFLVVARRPQAK
jgi:2-polyprenyl-3-methyl-5-hydroxy-6-metoxy-1,4-benzoquinol methylase